VSNEHFTNCLHFRVGFSYCGYHAHWIGKKPVVSYKHFTSCLLFQTDVFLSIVFVMFIEFLSYFFNGRCICRFCTHTTSPSALSRHGTGFRVHKIMHREGGVKYALTLVYPIHCNSFSLDIVIKVIKNKNPEFKKF